MRSHHLFRAGGSGEGSLKFRMGEKQYMFVQGILKHQGVKKAAVFLFVACCFLTWYHEKTKWIPQYGTVFYTMGLSCDDDCGPQRKLAYFNQALAYAPVSTDTDYDIRLSDASYRSAMIYRELGDEPGEIGALMKATRLHPSHTMAHYQIGRYYFRKQDYHQALGYFQKAASYSDYPDDIYYYLAKIYDEKGEYDRAVPHYDSLIAALPVYVDEVYPRLGEIYTKLGEEAAVRKLNRLRELEHFDLADRLEKELRAIARSKQAD